MFHRAELGLLDHPNIISMDLRQITLEYIRVLDACEGDSREEMSRYQASLLERLCRHARKTVPFYRERLDVLFDRQDRFSLERWDEVAILTRQEVIQNKEALTSTDVPESFGLAMNARTSGSTGEPVVALVTGTEALVSAAIVHRFHRWHGFDPTGYVASLVSRRIRRPNAKRSSEGKYWGYVYRTLDIAGRHVSLNAQSPIAEQVDWLEDMKPGYISSNPRIGLSLVNEYRRRGLSPSYTLNGFNMFGETRTVEIDDVIEDFFGVVPSSMYSAEELGNMAVECPQSRHYHVSEEINRLDIVDSLGRAVGLNVIGRVLVTPLYGYAMPRIRYEVGDEACPMPNCACGRPHATISRILGRTSNLFQRPDGDLYRPERGFITTARMHLGALAVQIAQINPRLIEVRYKSDPDRIVPPNEAQMTKEVIASVGYETDVRFVQVEGIPAKANGKREDFVREFKPVGE